MVASARNPPTPHALTADPILDRLRMALRAPYGPRLKRAVLYGSCARGAGRPDSDDDVAVFLHDLSDRWAELERAR